MSSDGVTLLFGLALLGVGLVLNRYRIGRRFAARRARRVDLRLTRLLDRAQVAEAVTVMLHEINRLRRVAATDEDRVRLASMLRRCANEYHHDGRLDEARPLAEEAVAVARVVAVSHPGHVAGPLVTLAQVLADQRDDDSALRWLREAYDDVRADTAGNPESDAQRVLVAANYSMVLRRVGAAEEAVAVARWGIGIDQGIAPGVLPPFTRASAGWLHSALAIAGTDAGQDGRAAAREAVEIWRGLLANGVFAEHESEGAGYADFALAYALRPFDPAAAEESARRASARFESLAVQAPVRLARRRAEVDALLAAMA
ncbi:tetratricopeptide repeat protein [Catellatospora tritici]|uniref:tetratricopeptide repeat protein n=1 Tax=Catellatospora tritici TaxID=2851566 RepID=UPI001C2D3FE0|nr:tetratricopeptide repeat protein [Catellatospora tritici]MBV1855273.1 tetratricopeptide repeat protein [Catellatospora tritici]